MKEEEKGSAFDYVGDALNLMAIDTFTQNGSST
jgi:hypothetical protein